MGERIGWSCARWRARLGLGFAAVLGAAVIVGFGPALAQELPLLGTRPLDGGVLAPDEVPPTARAVFAEPVVPGDPAVIVVDADGRQVDLGDAGQGPSAAVVEVSLPEDLPAGTYVGEWSVRTEDGTELNGAWSFEVVGGVGGVLGGRLGARELVVAAAVAVLVSGALIAWRRRNLGR